MGNFLQTKITKFLPSLKTATVGKADLSYGGLVLDGEGWELQMNQSGPLLRGTTKGELWKILEEESAGSKIVGIGVGGAGSTAEAEEVASVLWLKYDIVPIFVPTAVSASPKKLAKIAASKFDEQGIARIEVGEYNEIIPSWLTTFDEYVRVSLPQEIALLKRVAEGFTGKKIVFVSTTPRGGGVALMRHAMMRLYALAGVDASWHVLTESAAAFQVTKLKFHNILQGVSPAESVLTDQDIAVYNKWIAKNARLLRPVFEGCDVVVIDDPQPSGLVPYVKEANPDAHVLYRSHIHMVAELADTPGTPQHRTWNFIWQNIKECDFFIAHPIAGFVPSSIPPQKVYKMPAATDTLDGLNKELSEGQMSYYLDLFNGILERGGSTPLDVQRPYFIQIARFDPSKGIPDVVEAYRLLREKIAGSDMPVPQLVICGHSSIDDPEGLPVLSLVLEILKDKRFAPIAGDIKVVRLPHIDQLLNTLLRKSYAALQLSHKEGFEVKVTEALTKGKPVIAYEAGGIPLQIENGGTGFLVGVGDTQGVAQKMFEIYTDTQKYEELCRRAALHFRRDTSTLTNASKWLILATQALTQADNPDLSVFSAPPSLQGSDKNR